MVQDRHYYAARAADERRLAMASENLSARAVHLEMAARYDELVEAELDARLPIASEVSLKAGEL